MLRVLVLAASLFWVALPQAYGDYVVSATSGGASMLEVMPGDTFDLDILLTSDDADMHEAAIFRIIFSAAGLTYQGYSWGAPYGSDPFYDDSLPKSGDLPLAIDANALAGVGYPAGVVDIELANLVPLGAPAFGEGLLATLTFGVPLSISAPQTITIDIQPDTFALGFSELDATAGAPFVLKIVPEPATTGLLGILITLNGRRRRRLN